MCILNTVRASIVLIVRFLSLLVKIRTNYRHHLSRFHLTITRLALITFKYRLHLCPFQVFGLQLIIGLVILSSLNLVEIEVGVLEVFEVLCLEGSIAKLARSFPYLLVSAGLVFDF